MKYLVGTVSVVLAVIIAFFGIICIERVDVGNVGVVYSPSGVSDELVPSGKWKWLAPTQGLAEFPISEQQIVFSNNPADYNRDHHEDWSINAPANGGMVTLNLSVSYSFQVDRVVELYKRFNGMDGETLVENRIQNSMIAYVKEVTPKYTVMDIYADKKAEINADITQYLNDKLSTEYGIEIKNAMIIDVQLDETLMEKIRVKEQAKQDAEIAELEAQTALAEAEKNRVIAESEAQIAIIKAEADADIVRIAAEAQAESNQILAQSITEELIAMKEAEARMEHGWVTVQGAETVVTTAATPAPTQAEPVITPVQ